MHAGLRLSDYLTIVCPSVSVQDLNEIPNDAAPVARQKQKRTSHGARALVCRGRHPAPALWPMAVSTVTAIKTHTYLLFRTLSTK